MKLILIAILFSSICKAQTPGQELQEAMKHHYVGLGMATAGSLIIYGASRSNAYHEDKRPFYFAGGASLLAGTILQLTAWHHIGRAGRLMENKTSSIYLKPNSICYKF